MVVGDGDGIGFGLMLGGGRSGGGRWMAVVAFEVAKIYHR